MFWLDSEPSTAIQINSDCTSRLEHVNQRPFKISRTLALIKVAFDIC
jgi:hypothetical protein